MTAPATIHLVDLFTAPLGIPGGPEVWVIALVVLVLFGGRKLPGLARSMGSSITEFKKGLKEGEDEGTQKIEPSSKED